MKPSLMSWWWLFIVMLLSTAAHGQARKLGKKAQKAPPQAAQPEINVPAGKELLVLFRLTCEKSIGETLDLINAEMFMVVDSVERFKVIGPEDLGEEMMMEPQEALAFCADEAPCIADLGSSRGARWIIHGDMEPSAEGNLLSLRIRLIDVAEKKVSEERFGQFELNERAVLESGNLVRDLLGIPVSKPAATAAKPSAPGAPQAGIARKTKDGEPDDSSLDQGPAGKGKSLAASAKARAGRRSGPWSNPWMWTAASVGLAGLGAGTAFALLSQSQTDQGRNATDHPSAYSHVQDARSYALGANIGWGVGGALLTTAIALFTWDALHPSPAVACVGFSDRTFQANLGFEF